MSRPMRSLLCALLLLLVAVACQRGAGQDARPGEGAEPAEHDAVAFYTCAMHPSVRSKDPGSCPICSMTLTPVTRGEVESGVVILDGRRRQAIGVETAVVGREPLVVTLRAAGRVVVDETRVSDVTVRVRGFVGTLHAAATGVLVRAGEPLLTLYSPDLLAGQEELLTALRSQRAAQATSAPERADYLVAAARERLRLWGMTERQIGEVERSGKPIEYSPIVAPVTGHVVEKDVVAGAAVEPGVRLYRIAALDRVWVEAEVDESELSLVRTGQPVSVVVPSLPGRPFQGSVSFVAPVLDPTTRTGRARIELANADLALRPDTYAEVRIVHDLGERLVVPEEAVLYAGERRFVFVELGGGRFVPREVRIGLSAGERVEVLGGIEEGEVVVTSGNFLIAAESRLRVAMEHWK
jgi:Cu(I)/Ag(I) efflux system membrane fusion protein